MRRFCRKILSFLVHPGKILLKFDHFGLLRLKDRTFLKLQYKSALNKRMNLEKPLTFNEKMQWLKLYDRNPRYTRLVDKYAVKEEVAKKIGERYIVHTYGVYDSFGQIDFDELPDSFVIKTTHFGGSHGVFIVKDKRRMDIRKIKKGINNVLGKNLYYYSREWPYKNVKPRIIIEEYVDGLSGDAVDYKFMCYNGKVENIFTCTERFSGDLKVTFFDRFWNRLPFERSHPRSKKKIPAPPDLNKMITLSERLAEGIPFVRIDFYNPRKGVIKFGEFTLYPGAGLEAFQPEIWDRKLGDLIKLPEKKREK